MREAAFVKQNGRDWETFEQILDKPNSSDADLIADLFIKLTNDLAYAQTRFPGSYTEQYLNALAARAHQAIYRNKKENSSRIIQFWTIELPNVMYGAQKQLLYAFTIFATAVLIGAVSTAHDDTFVRLILGDAYVNMTLENIQKDDPMAVYKSMHGTDMFFAITFNNVRVSFITFIAGLFFSFGTAYFLFTNGVMLGAFQYFFYQQQLFATSALTIWIHGTLEISAIIIAGAAGLTMGNGLLFPGTHSRLQSLKISARKGLKITVGLIPIFIMAGFLESFITRLTDWPWFIKLSIIVASALFILYYFILLPIKKHTDARQTENNTATGT